MEEFKYWCDKGISVDFMRGNIEGAKMDIERYENEEAIVDIHIGDHHGKYTMERMTCLLLGISEEEYWEKYEGELEEEIWDFDELVDKVNEELEEYVEEFELLPEGYSISFGWHDGGVATLLHKIG